MNKDIAVIMSVYKNDSLEFLKESLESLYSQTLQNFEIFIQIDGNVSPEIDSFLDSELNGGNIKYIGKRHQNKGLAFSLNELLDLTLDKYEYLARMDSDDICSRNRIESQYEFLKNNQDIDVVGSEIIEFYDDGSEREILYSHDHDSIKKNFRLRTAIPHVSAFFRSSFFIKAGKYNTKSNRNEDQWLWLEGFKNNCRFACIKEPLVRVRLSKDLLERRVDLKHNFDTFLLRNKIITELKFPSYLFIYNFLIFITKMMPSWVLKFVYKLR